MTTALQSSNPARKVPARRISFEEQLATLPRHFAGDGDLLGSHLTACLSSVFPDGEDFFVKSVRHFRDQITDPDLKRQVAGFIGQEAMHGKDHRAFNDLMIEHGYDEAPIIDGRLRKFLGFIRKTLPPMSQLAATTALEHFTAMLAEQLLADERMHDDVHESVRPLWLWHALEESEHKAVAFDVYKAVGGSERMRVLTMKFLRYGFVAAVATQVAVSLALDKQTYKPGVLRKSLKRFSRSPVVHKRVWEQLKDYDRPDFHPDDSDTDALVEHWRSVLFGEEGSLNDKLAGAASAVA
jgi:predicted metal-dependent hydrolase